MKIKTIITFIIFFIVFSCKTSFNVENENIVSSKQISKNEILKLYRFTRNYNIKYSLNIDGKYVDRPFKPIIYTYVRPLKEDPNNPEKIYSPQSYYKKSVDYFRDGLNGINVSYLAKDDEIIFRAYYHDYNLDKKNKSQDKPTNIMELKKYLEIRKINYKILKEGKKDQTQSVDLMIGNQYYKIYLNSDMCNSYSIYNLKDSININNFSNQINNFYW